MVNPSETQTPGLPAVRDPRGLGPRGAALSDVTEILPPAVSDWRSLAHPIGEVAVREAARAMVDSWIGAEPPPVDADAAKVIEAAVACAMDPAVTQQQVEAVAEARRVIEAQRDVQIAESCAREKKISTLGKLAAMITGVVGVVFLIGPRKRS